MCALYLSNFVGESQEEVYCRSRVVLSNLDIASYSGYITVDQEKDCNLFFWYFPSRRAPPETSPLIMYLNGGPGNSSMLGLFLEAGPLTLDKQGHVGLRETHWADQFSLVFVDNPVGVGFSYCKEGAETRTNNIAADHLYRFLTQFLQLYSCHQHCDLYLCGISYGGKYVPALAHKIHIENSQPNAKVVIGLKGVIVMGGLFDPALMLPHYPDLLVALGLLSDKEGHDLRSQIKKVIIRHQRYHEYEQAMQDLDTVIFDNMNKKLGFLNLENGLNTNKLDEKFQEFLNDSDMQKRMNVRQTKYESSKYQTMQDMAPDFFNNVFSELAVLMDNYKVLVVTGQFDLLVSAPMTEVFLKKLSWSGQEAYVSAEKQVWLVGQDLAGFVTKVNNFTRVVMRNAGHRCAIDQPKWTLAMISHFISDHQLF